jgi:thiamine pyridinylase
MIRVFSLVACLCLNLSYLVGDIQAADPPARRQLRVALYPYVPERAEMYWKVEQEFEDANPAIDVRFVDLSAYYYSGQLEETLTKSNADVVEVDTVLLRDLVDKKLVEELPGTMLPPDTFLDVATNAAKLDGKVYGVPHWVCGNFLFFRKDDPEASRFRKLTSLDGLERLVARPHSQEQSVLSDLRGSSTLGEKYLDALLDRYKTPDEALKHLNPDALDQSAVDALNRLFALSPGGLCDSEKHHEFGQFYARQFAERRCRAMVGYSERLHFTVDHYLNGIREDQPGVGKIVFEWSDATSTHAAVGADDIDAVPATLSDSGTTMLSWVDVLSVRNGVSDQVRKDAHDFIRFFNSSDRTTTFLIPEYGHAPRYLLPAHRAIYGNAKLLKAAPLYSRFHEIMGTGIAVTAPDLNGRLRKIGKTLESQGFSANK